MRERTLPSAGSPPLLHYIDVVLLLLAAPILLLIGVPAIGYGIGAATWIISRAFGVAVERHAGGLAELSRQLTLRLGYRLTRVFLLAAAVILAQKAGVRHDGLTALLVTLFAFTIHLALSIVERLALR